MTQKQSFIGRPQCNRKLTWSKEGSSVHGFLNNQPISPRTSFGLMKKSLFSTQGQIERTTVCGARKTLMTSFRPMIVTARTWRYYKEEQALPYISGKTRSIRAPGAAPRDSSNHKHPHIQCCTNIVCLATLHPFNTALILYAWQLNRSQNPQLTLKRWYFVVSFRPVQSLLLFIIPPWARRS